MNFLISSIVSVTILLLSFFIKHICIRLFLWGLIVAPLSTTLYSLFFIPYIGIIFTPLLLFSQFFNKPAWWLLVEKTNVINGTELSFFHEILLFLVNGVFWGIVFLSLACFYKIIRR
jgi:hypothetical protein